jgi:pimeloyl-ACP methyl ester carboxylesterase
MTSSPPPRPRPRPRLSQRCGVDLRRPVRRDPDAGHYGYPEQPAPVNAALLDFLKENA